MKKGLKIVIVLISILLIIVIGEFIYYKLSYNKDHKVLLTILSDGGYECEYVKLDIYDDNTYAFYNEIMLKEAPGNEPNYIGYEDNPTVGAYKYDVTELINSLKNGSKNDAKSKYVYIVEDNEGNRYYVGSSNKELKKLLNSMFLKKIRVNLNTCPKYK